MQNNGTVSNHVETRRMESSLNLEMCDESGTRNAEGR